MAFAADWDGDPNIYIIFANGSGLFQFSNNPDRDTDPVWSSDGSTLAFVTNARSAPRVFVQAADGSPGRIIAPDLEVTTARVDLSPKGDQAAFRSLDDLYVVDTISGRATLLTPNPDMNPSNPVFSPDGATLLFKASDPVRGSDALFIVNADGTGLTKLTSVLSSVHQPAWHPSGDKILFEQVETPSEGVALHVVSLDGAVEKLPLVPVYRATSAKWSPDGSMIGYIVHSPVRNSNGELLSKDSLYVAIGDGSVNIELLGPPEDPEAELPLHELVWAPDSRHIAYTAVADGETDLYVLDVCSGVSSLVVENIDFFSTPSWRPSGDESS